MDKELEKTMPSAELTENKPLEGTIMTEVSEFPEEVFIDDRLTDEQKAVIKKVIDNLPPEERKNVIYVTPDGKIYANRLELIDEYKIVCIF